MLVKKNKLNREMEELKNSHPLLSLFALPIGDKKNIDFGRSNGCGGRCYNNCYDDCSGGCYAVCEECKW